MAESALPKVPWWSRLLGLTVSLLLLTWIVRHSDGQDFMGVLRKAQPGWFLAAFLALGVSTMLAAVRWHRFLRLTQSVTHPTATVRSVVIGQAFNSLLFGGAGGDIVKGSFYSRWYRYPMPQVLAACVYDRLIGSLGSVLIGLMVLALAANGRASVILQRIKWPEIDYGWVFLVLFAVLLAGVWLRGRSRRGGFVADTTDSLREAFGRLRERPSLALQGVLYSFLVQLFIASLLALNLQAVSPTPLPWRDILWTFPIISFVASIPLSISGAGLREGAAILLLKPYGITGSQIIAAGVLTFLVYLAWIGIGLFLFWRESRRIKRAAAIRPVPKSISVVIPVLNESKELAETVRRVREQPEVVEIIVVDGGSRDGTASIAEGLGCKVISSPPGRGGQMRRGAELATGDVVLLLHADTWLPAGSGEAVIAAMRDPTVVGGGFWKTFRDGSLLMTGSRFRCGPRILVFHRVLGDQGMFVRREVLESFGGVPDQPLMEEFELCRRMRLQGRIALADATVTTSARRFAKLGAVRTYFRMGKVTLLYWMGWEPTRLRALYERD
ncbi:MAG TPA: TIGR04283 family arsenosugar biosynthesis glycosyltransferase [Roseimicrobium sp.]|nr:TIGR04283 family arsenosugar biosynthesis glycosyltransferase [Roseimicrobium sp.]